VLNGALERADAMTVRGRARHIFLILSVSLAATVLLPACGNESGPSKQQPDRSAKSPNEPASRSEHRPGEYPADRDLSPEEVVRAYVAALNNRDGRRFCGLVAPYISGRFDLAGRDPDSGLRKLSGCPELVSAFIGYIEDCCPPEFQRVVIDHMAGPVKDGQLTRLDLDLTIHVKKDNRPATMPLKDTVWLARMDGAWRVAKLSAVARAASLAVGDDDPDPRSAPNVDAEQQKFESEVEAFEKRQGEREASFKSTGNAANCSGGISNGDPADDLVDYRFPAPKEPIPATPRADLRAVQVVSRGGSICVRFETAGDIKGPMTFTFNLRDSASGGRFIQMFDVNLRANRTAQVTSGDDTDGHPLSVPAQVGVTGRRLALVLDRMSFEHGEPSPVSRGEPPLDRFAFIAQVQTPLGDDRVVNDDLGPSSPSYSYSYPAGRICRPEC
jgi:hypothetical protein